MNADFHDSLTGRCARCHANYMTMFWRNAIVVTLLEQDPARALAGMEVRQGSRIGWARSKLIDFAPHSSGRKQRQMTNDHGSDHCPELGGLQHYRRRDRRISEHTLQRVQSAESSFLAGPKQLAAHFVIRDLRNHHLDTVVGKTREPVLARLIFWRTFRICDHPERTGVPQNDQAHEK